MLKSTGRLGFLDETASGIGFLVEFRVQSLNGNGPLQIAVKGLKHLTHPSLAQQ